VYLDLCAGTLDVAAQLARLPGFRGSIIGADFAEPMLRAGYGKAPAEVVRPVVADALFLPLADESVDGAIVGFGIRNLNDLDAGLREVLRVLRPGARFVILEFSTPRSAVVRALYNAYFHHVLPAVGGAVSGHHTAYRDLRTGGIFRSPMRWLIA
jgi:demethylmenaquinone methyltransferase/2-methoxy-6-polyprenyl-1,4-benzoquinol methylase